MKHYFLYFYLYILGLTFASFSNVVIYRFLRFKNLKEIFGGRSFCPNCKATIRWYDNIPLISYLILKGRCRHCGWKIPLRYPIVELLGGIIPVLVYWQFSSYGLITVIAYSFLLYLLLILSFTDLLSYTVPNFLVGIGILGGLTFSLLNHQLIESLIGILLGFSLVMVINILYEKIRGITPLGYGDAKFLALIGSFLGYKAIFPTVLFGSLFALLVYLPQVIKNKTIQFVIPFVPFLSLGTIIYLFFLAK